MTITARVARILASSHGLFVIALLAGALCGFGFRGVGELNHVVVAQFANADGLVAGNEVRIAGVGEGTVQSVASKVDPGTGQQSAVVEFTVDSGHWPLHEGTAVAVTPKGVLSNVFVSVIPGSPNNPSLGDRPFFGVNSTQSPVGLDELNNVFTPSVTESIRTQLQEGVIALGGSGAADLNQTLHYANPLTFHTIPLIDVLATRSPQLDSLNISFDTITGDLAREDANLRPLIVNLDTTLGALATKESELQGTLVHAAGVFTDLNLALDDSRTQNDLKTIFMQGEQSLACAQAASDYLEPLIQQVNPYISYQPNNLDTLLKEFVTATGFNMSSQAPPYPSSSSNSINSLIIDPTLPPAGYSSSDSGGLSHEHGGSYHEGQPLSLPSSLAECTLPSGTGQ